MNLPLASLRIISIEQYGAGPFASMYLAAMGAEVIKIEPPGVGDASRASGPHFLGDHDSLFFQSFNQGKRSLTLDLKQPAGQQILKELVATADAVMNNLRGDQPERFGLTYDILSQVRADIVCLHLSGYGRGGSRASRPAYDYLMQAEAGFMSLTGEPGGPPQRMGLSVVDYLSGLTSAFALTACLFGAKESGLGQDVDVSLFDVAIQQLTYPATWYLNAGDVTKRRQRSGHPYIVPCELLPTSNGHIFVMCVLPKFWRALCEVLGLPELLYDERFASPGNRRRNRDALMTDLDQITNQQTTEHWMAALAGKVPVAPVLGLDEALDNPYLEEVEAIGSIDHPEAAGFRMLRNPIRLAGARPELKKGPNLGEDTDFILAQLGYSDAECRALREAGTV